MPVPRKNETKEHFIRRGMKYHDLSNKDPKQRAAILYSIWNQHHNKGKDRTAEGKSIKSHLPRNYVYKLQDGTEAVDAPLRDMEFDTGKMSATGLLATGARDRKGDVIDLNGIDYSAHQLNSIVLLDHGINHPLPIGLTRKNHDPNDEYLVFPDLDADEILQTSFFSQSSEVALQVYSLYAEGILRANSIGFVPIEKKRLPDAPMFPAYPKGCRFYSKIQMTDATFCGLPCNPETVYKVLSRDLIEGKSITEAVKLTLLPFAPGEYLHPKSYSKGVDLPKGREGKTLGFSSGKSYVTDDEYQLIGKADRSHLVKKQITDKLGRKRTVWVDPDKGKPADKKSKKEESSSGDVAGRIQELKKDLSKVTPEHMAEVAGKIKGMSGKQIDELKKSLDVKASGSKAAMADKIVKLALTAKAEKSGKKEKPKKPTVDELHTVIQGLKSDPKQATPEKVSEIAGQINQMTGKEITLLKQALGVKASGAKAVMAKKVIEAALKVEKEKPAKTPKAVKEKPIKEENKPVDKTLEKTEKVESLKPFKKGVNGGAVVDTNDPKVKKIGNEVLSNDVSRNAIADAYNEAKLFIEYSHGDIPIDFLLKRAQKKDPSLTLPQLQAALMTAWDDRKLELHVQNEVGKLSENERASSIDHNNLLYHYVRAKGGSMDADKLKPEPTK